MVVNKIGNDHKPWQTSTTDNKRPVNDHKPPAKDRKLPINNHKLPQTTGKLTQTSNKRTQSICERPIMATRAHQTKKMMFRFFFPQPVITRINRIFKNIGSQWGANCLLLSQYLCGACKIGYACFGRLSA